MHVSCHTFVLLCVACPYKFPHILLHRFSSNSQYQEKPVHSLCQSSLEMKFGLWLIWLNSILVQLLRKLKAFLRQLGIAVQESWLKFVYYLWYSNLCKFSFLKVVDSGKVNLILDEIYICIQNHLHLFTGGILKLLTVYDLTYVSYKTIEKLGI